MADITMCSGNQCPIKKDCYRYMAKPNSIRQSYFMKPPIKLDDSCEEFIKLKSAEVLK
jgi:hypothetical protein